MSSSEEQSTSQEVSEETSRESGTESSNAGTSSGGSSNPSNDSDSAGHHGDKTQRKRKRRTSKGKKLAGHRAGRLSNRSRNTTDSATTDETDASQSMGEVTDKSSTEGQDTSASDTGSAVAAEDPNWSMSEDFILLNMKNDHRKPSWNEIAQAMHKSKKDVKARWKVLQNNMNQPSSQDDGLSESEEKEQPKSMKKKNQKRRSRKRASKKKPSAPVEETAVLSGDESSMKEVSPEHTPRKQVSASSSSDGDSLTYAGSDREIRRQKKYLQKHIRSKLFPPDKYPTADETFSQADCEVLASVESQYKRSKWLEMQANFYNVTGRLVPIELIRARCEREDNSNGDGSYT